MGVRGIKVATGKIKVGMRGISVEMWGMRVGILEMCEMWGIRVGKRGIRVAMWGIMVGMLEIRVGMRVYKYLTGILQGFC